MSSSSLFYSGQYKRVLEHLVANLKNICSCSQENVKSQIRAYIHEAVNELELCAKNNPLGFPVNLHKTGDWQDILKTIAAKAEDNFKKGCIEENIIFGGYYEDCIGNDRFISPLSISGKEFCQQVGNIVLTYTQANKSIAIDRLNNIVMTLLLSLPPKKVMITIVDFGMECSAGFLTGNLDSGIFHDEVLVDQSAYTAFTRQLQQTISDRIKQSGHNPGQNTSGYLRDNFPMEIVLLLGDPDRYDYHWSELKPIWENGRKCGVHFIALKDLTSYPNRNDTPPALAGLNYIEIKDSCPQYRMDTSDTVSLTPVAQTPGLANLCFEYLNKGFREKEKAETIKDKTVVGNSYDDCLNGILDVEIGKSDKASVHFELDLISHIHAFILGMSGSGKSVLLHNIIVNLLGKYPPEQLELYLLDFKLGGVEFNRYRDTKHTKALLVDNSDNSVVLEILRELNTAMYERGKQLKSANVQRIDEYNRLNPDNPMPQILTVIDECHNIFNLEGGRQTGIQREVLGILTKITKEGRNQGVHLIMATQTLSGADIPGEILNNISDHYLLKCAQSDSERLAPGSSTITFGLPTGKVYHHHQSGNELFQGFYIGDTALENKIALVNEKASDRRSNGQFYFSGSQIFTLTQEVAESIFTDINLVLTPGELCSLRHKPIVIPLQKQDAQNILVTGIDSHNTLRTTLALLDSAIRYNQKATDKYRIAVINCLDVNNRIQQLADEGLIILADSREKRAQLIGELSNGISCAEVKPTILFILGQQLFRELKKDLPITISVDKIPESNEGDNEMSVTEMDLLLDVPDLPQTNEEFDFGFDDADADFLLTQEKQPETTGRETVTANVTVNTTFGKALRTVLNRGPELGIHTIMMIDKPANILFEDYQSKKALYGMFAHLLIHRGDESTANVLGLRDDIRPENLTPDEERLKAIYFNEERDSYTVFSPYIIE